MKPVGYFFNGMAMYVAASIGTEPLWLVLLLCFAVGVVLSFMEK